MNGNSAHLASLGIATVPATTILRIRVGARHYVTLISVDLWAHVGPRVRAPGYVR
jgi:hypothetical protein